MLHRTFEAEWQVIRPTIAGYLFARLGDHQIADDLEQEIAVAAWEGRHRVASDRSFAAWVMGIARHKVIDHFRHHGSGSWELLPTDATSDLETLALAEAERQQRRVQALRRCLAALPATQRDLIEAYYLEEQRTDRLARRLSLSLANVKVRLHRIRQALRRCIDRHSGPKETP